MKIVVGSDHAGFTLKQEIVERVSHLGHEVQDLGAYNSEPSDYPDFAKFLVKEGIESMSLNPDTVIKIIMALGNM